MNNDKPVLVDDKMSKALIARLQQNRLNKVLLLRAIQLSGGKFGFSHLCNIVFEIQRTLKGNTYTNFDYYFIKWTCEPYSDELTDDFEFLAYKKFIKRNANKGIELGDAGNEFLGNNIIINDKTDDVIKKTVAKAKIQPELYISRVSEEYGLNNRKMDEYLGGGLNSDFNLEESKRNPWYGKFNESFLD